MHAEVVLMEIVLSMDTKGQNFGVDLQTQVYCGFLWTCIHRFTVDLHTQVSYGLAYTGLLWASGAP